MFLYPLLSAVHVFFKANKKYTSRDIHICTCSCNINASVVRTKHGTSSVDECCGILIQFHIFSGHCVEDVCSCNLILSFDS